MDLNILREKLEQCWDEKTSFCKNNDSRGQCYVTALLLKDLFGGDVMHGYVELNEKNEHHFWNRINGLEIDLTSDQYGGDGINPVTDGGIYRRLNFKNKRFLLLKERFYAINK